jgi:hypothetical protein
MRVCLLILWGLVAASICGAATIEEDFSCDPLQKGWKIFGDTNLFHWDSTNQNLDVTWDSSQSNSYFYLPLGTILAKSDDFSLAFDLRVDVAQASGFGFELAVGFLNLAEATSTNFNRSTGDNSPDLVEFTYFPDAGFGPTVWPILVDTNSLFNWTGASNYAIYAPMPGDWYHIVMTYTASNQTLVTTMANFEQTSGITVVDPLMTNFTDFRVDTISINSYRDDGQGDSIFAQGAVDNLVVTLPPPPIQNLSGAFGNGIWQAQFLSRSNWVYRLQRTTDLQTWTNISPATAGNGTNLLLPDAHPPTDQAFYRISAQRP